MKEAAVVNYASAALSVELRTVDRSPIGADDVLLEVAAVSVCGSDVHQWRGTHGWPVRYPVILGHEFAGVVASVGERVRSFAVGERVVSETAAIINPDSLLTRRGLYNLDASRKGFGYGVDGAMTRFVHVPARVPDNVSFAHAALVEPCCVAYNAAVHHADIKPGDRVVVLGPGPIGILCALMARLQGAEVVVVGLESDRARLDVVERYGLTPYVGDPVTEADGVIDAAGASRALRIVRPAGWITKVGWGPEPFAHSLDPLVQKNITLRGSFSHNYPIWESVLGLLSSGRLQLDPLIGGQWPLAQWRAAFDAMHEARIVKAILRP